MSEGTWSNRYTIPKPSHGSQDWLDVRWQNVRGEKIVTASVAACVHGTHKYKTTADLAIELLAKTAPTPSTQNDAMRRGTILEGPLMKWAGEMLGLNIVEPQVLYAYEEPGVRMLATMDGQSELAFHELKTYNKLWDGVLSETWRWQGVHQAICVGVPSIEWIVFDSSLQLQFVKQDVSSDERQEHIDAVRNFLSYVDMGMLPPDAVPTYENASTLYPEEFGNTVVLDAAVLDTLWELAVAKEQIKNYEAVKDACQGALGMLLGDAEYGSIGGARVVSWKSSSRESFDQARFKVEHPALFAKFQKHSSFRTMRVTPTKGDK